MNSEHKDNFTDETAQIAPLNEKALEDVSGGFTIINTCQKRWSEMICNAMWGMCPNLSLTPSDKGKYHLASCKNGHFSNVEYY